MPQTRFTIAVLALVGTSVYAQYDPSKVPTYDAGALARQAEQMFKQSQLQRNLQNAVLLPPELVVTDATLVSVERFKFNGNKILSNEQLQAVTASYANRPLKQHDLQLMTTAISEAYRQIGWIVQAYIPRQDFANSEMILQIIETIPPSKPMR
jgi:hemolysin activation/secretion protein